MTSSNTYKPVNSRSAFLPVEFDLPKEEQQMRNQYTERERLTATILNVKENGTYEKNELLNGQQWFSTNANNVNTRYQPRYGYRITYDLLAITKSEYPMQTTIGAGATVLHLSKDTNFPSPQGFAFPIPSYGAATAQDGVSIFLNDPQVFVRYNSGTNEITITNNYGHDLIYCVWALQYLKN